jgi:hypothetical protein
MNLNENIIARAVERGAKPIPGGVLFEINNATAAVAVPDDLSVEACYQRIGAAVQAVSSFTQAVTKVLADPRLSGAAKASDVARLAGAAKQAILDTAIATAEQVAAAEREAAAETGATPIPASDSVAIALDAERRAVLRGLPLAEAMRHVQSDRLAADAVLRLPMGFPTSVVEFAQRAVAAADPNAFGAARRAADWRRAQATVEGCQQTVDRLSRGRGEPVAAAAA